MGPFQGYPRPNTLAFRQAEHLVVWNSNGKKGKKVPKFKGNPASGPKFIGDNFSSVVFLQRPNDAQMYSGKDFHEKYHGSTNSDGVQRIQRDHPSIEYVEYPNSEDHLNQDYSVINTESVLCTDGDKEPLKLRFTKKMSQLFLLIIESGLINDSQFFSLDTDRGSIILHLGPTVVDSTKWESTMYGKKPGFLSKTALLAKLYPEVAKLLGELVVIMTHDFDNAIQVANPGFGPMFEMTTIREQYIGEFCEILGISHLKDKIRVPALSFFIDMRELVSILFSVDATTLSFAK